MAYGLSTAGLTIPRLTDIQADIFLAEQGVFGLGINLMASSFNGQFVGIFSERLELVWQAVLSVYSNFNPQNAGGVSLDYVCAITGIRRLPATFGTNGINPCYAYGTQGTVVPSGSIVSVNGNASAQFATTADVTIGPGTDAVQHTAFNAVPDAGVWTLIYNGNSTGSLAFNANAAAIQTALNSVTGLSGVAVAGNYTSGFDITFSGSNGQQPQSILQVGINTLTHTATPVTVIVTTTTPGVLPNVAVNVQCTQTGAIPAYANTLTVINTPIAGWIAFNNPDDIVPGNDIESDAALRLRRELSLAFPGSSNVDAIYSKVSQIVGVLAAVVFENVTLITDANNLPGKSFEAVVLGGSDQDIANVIWGAKPAGIESYGLSSAVITDSQGYSHTINFGRPTQIPIYVIVNIHVLANYPVGGDTTLKQDLKNYGAATFGIGKEVTVSGTNGLNNVISQVQGIETSQILIGTSPSPGTSTPVPISFIEISSWDTANFTVNHV